MFLEGVGDETKRCETKQNAWKRYDTEGNDTSCETKRNGRSHEAKQIETAHGQNDDETKRNGSFLI